jgi:translation elongation factor P/translation initiation factor 5A
MDISEFKPGDQITTISGDVFDVISYNYSKKSGKKYIESSKCRNVKNGQIINITWGKNKSFKYYG